MHILVRAFVELQVKPLKDGQVESSAWEMILRAQGNCGSQMREERADAKRTVIPAWWLLAEVRMEVEVLVTVCLV